MRCHRSQQARVTTPRESRPSHAPADENQQQDRPRPRNGEPRAITFRSRNPRSQKFKSYHRRSEQTRKRVDTDPMRTPPHRPGTAKPTVEASRTDLELWPPTKPTPTPQTCPNRRPHTRSVTTEASNSKSVASRIRSSSRDPEPGRSTSPMRERESGGAKQERHRRPSTPAKGTTDVVEERGAVRVLLV